jgi:molybdenum cofactor cytidylyltransferase
MSEPWVAGLVVAAGRSRTVGRPTPLLPYAGATLLDYTLGTARACEFDQLLVAVESDADMDKVRARVNLSGAEVVPTLEHAMAALDPKATVLVLLRCDQPRVAPATVRILLAARGDAALAVCSYDDGRGHPIACGREVFDDLRAVPADHALWRLLDRHAGDVAEVPVAGRVPPDVGSWADYEAVVAAAGHAFTPELSSRVAESTGGWRRRFRD